MNYSEVWKTINGYEDFYEVSNSGRIRSKYRITNDGRKLNGKILRPVLDKDGYEMVGLSVNKKRFPKKIHRLVAEAFLPNPENLPCVNHKDGNKQNNCVENLEWVTVSQNNKHAYETGLKKPIRGEEHKFRKLSSEDVSYIRENCIPNSKDFGMRAMSRKFNVCLSTIRAIYNGKKWKVV